MIRWLLTEYDKMLYGLGYTKPNYPMPAATDLMPVYYYGLDSVIDSDTFKIQERQWQDECAWLDSLSYDAWLSWYNSQ